MRRGGGHAFVYVFWGLPIFMAACSMQYIGSKANSLLEEVTRKVNQWRNRISGQQKTHQVGMMRFSVRFSG
ncbi:hypothetical protein MHH67_19440 [Bacillus sp. FSL K6-0047]